MTPEEKNWIRYLAPAEIAHRYQDANQWAEAAKWYRRVGTEFADEQAAACELIAESNRQGDEYRKLIDQECGPEPAGERTTANKEWMTWYHKMGEVYKKWKAKYQKI